jgi:hypothetical protein
VSPSVSEPSRAQGASPRGLCCAVSGRSLYSHVSRTARLAPSAHARAPPSSAECTQMCRHPASPQRPSLGPPGYCRGRNSPALPSTLSIEAARRLSTSPPPSPSRRSGFSITAAASIVAVRPANSPMQPGSGGASTTCPAPSAPASALPRRPRARPRLRAARRVDGPRGASGVPRAEAPPPLPTVAPTNVPTVPRAEATP